jgi:hypothetical protein
VTRYRFTWTVEERHVAVVDIDGEPQDVDLGDLAKVENADSFQACLDRQLVSWDIAEENS